MALCPPRFWPSAVFSCRLGQVRLPGCHSLCLGWTHPEPDHVETEQIGGDTRPWFFMLEPQFFSPKVGMNCPGEFKSGRAEERERRRERQRHCVCGWVVGGVACQERSPSHCALSTEQEAHKVMPSAVIGTQQQPGDTLYPIYHR